MAENNDFAMGYAMGQDSGGNSGGFGGFGDGWLGLILFAMIFGWGGNGFGGGFGGGYGGQALTRAELYDGFAIQNIDSAVRGVQNGISDATYALSNSISNGFHGVDRAVCDIGYAIKDCCCQTQRSIDGVRYDMTTQLCGLGNTIQNGFRDVIEGQNAGTRAILDFLTQDKIATLTAENQSLKFAASQASQNAFITANQEAQTAELIRRLGRDCPVPAYVVPNPNCCYGNPVGIGYGNSGGCGCGCG